MKAFVIAIALAVTGPLPVEVVTVGGVRVRLAETSFAAIEKSLGPVRRVSAGDGEAGRTQSCYRTPGAVPTTVYFTSGEMGGGKKITEVSVVGSKSAAADYYPSIASACGVLRATAFNIQTDRGVKLGMTRSAVERLVGRAGRDSAGVTTYEADGVRRRNGVRYDVTSKLRVRYETDRVTAFYALGFQTF